MDLFVQKIGSKIYREKEYFVVERKEEGKEYFVVERKEEGKEYFSYNLIDNIIIQEGNQLTSDFLLEIIEKDIPLYLGDKYGNIRGKFIPITYNSNSNIRERQYQLWIREYGKELGKSWIMEKIENQKNRYKLYMELFAMLEEEDRKYMLKQILRNIECDMREKGIYAENKKEIDRLKKEIENGIEYDF